MRDLFLTEDWFRLLQRQGLTPAPRECRTVGLRAGAAGDVPVLHLKQDQDGGTWSSLSNYYTAVYGPQGDGTHLTADDWALAARELRQWPGGGALRLEPLDADSAWLPVLKEGALRAGYRIWEEPAFGNWFQPVEPGVHSTYWQARPSALRNTVDRATRRLDRAGEWSVEIFASGQGNGEPDATALGRMTDAYLSVYANSWKPQEPNAGFMPAFIGLAARHGCLRLGVLWLQGKPLAAQIWLVYPGRSAQIFKLAHVKGEEKWSAGSVLTAELACHSIEQDKVRELDFLSGDDAYKADWMEHRRIRTRLYMAHPMTGQGLASWGRHFLRSVLGQ